MSPPPDAFPAKGGRKARRGIGPMAGSTEMTALSLADIRVRPIRSDNVWRWLSAGWHDLWRRPAISLGYGLFVALLSYAVLACLYFVDAIYLFLPLAAGFMFGGPVIAVGLYEMSRRYGEGSRFGPMDVFGAVGQAPLQLAYMGLVLLLFALLWIRIATLLFALFFGAATPPLASLFESLFLSFQGVAFLAVGTGIGAILAFAAYAISAVSIPLIVDREVDAMTATIASLASVRDNFVPMMLWGWLIAIFTAVGIATLFLGLILFFPLLGHASWHCYRDVLGIAEGDPA